MRRANAHNKSKSLQTIQHLHKSWFVRAQTAARPSRRCSRNRDVGARQHHSPRHSGPRKRRCKRRQTIWRYVKGAVVAPTRDDVLPTASAMLAELYRRDARGFVHDRSEENRLILTCRFVAILMASILKSKGMPARVRSGFDPYATPRPDVSCDHWITQYWSAPKSKWITIDVDCCLCGMDFDPYDMPDNTFEWSADVWLKARRGEVDPKCYWNAGGFEGLMPISWELFYDFHCIMNNEIIYLHSPDHLHPGKFDKLTEAELKEIDEIAELMQDPDENFEALQNVFDTNRKFRLLTGALL